MNEMMKNRMVSYKNGVITLMKKHEDKSAEAVSSATAVKSAKRGLGTGGGCLR